METVFIADDEQSIREGLKKVIDWKSRGFDICGDAANGEDALNRIIELNPSLVILDICMPKMHGIDVIAEARARGYDGKIIIISGFSDFKYAQGAIKYGVTNYLTKPVDEEELESIVKEIYSEIKNRHESDRLISHYKAKARKEILDDLVTGHEDIALLDLDELNLSADVYQVVMYEQFLKDSDSSPYSFAELLRVSDSASAFEQFEKNGHDVVILKGNTSIERFKRFLYHYTETPPQKNSPLGTLFLAYGCKVSDLSELPESYEQARALMGRRFFCAEGQHTLGYSELPLHPTESYELDNNNLNNYCADIEAYLSSFNRKMISHSLDEITDYLYNSNVDVPSMKLFLTDMFLQIKEHVNHTYSTFEIPFLSNSEIIEFIDRQFYLYEIISFFTEQFEMIMNTIGNSSRDSILDDIIFYIDHNYQNNLKLETIAPLFGYNSAYLGKIFSKTVGESFNNYVDHVRIEHAKQLILDNSYKVYEISEMVGYKNVDYFHKKFKKYVGVSPAEFRKVIN